MRAKSGILISVTAVTLAGALIGATVLQANAASQDRQEPPQQQEQPQQGQSPSPSQQPTFRAGVTLITTDVIVRDSAGQFVADLTETDFEVFEDGVLQEIASLTLVHGGRVYNQLEPERRVLEGIVLPPSRPTSDTAGRVFIIFVDDLHLEPGSTARVRRLFRQIGETLIHEGDLFGVVSTGPSAIAIDMTYDRALLKVAEGKIMGTGMTFQDIRRQMDGAQGPAETRYLAHTAFQTAHEVVKNLELVENRRKAFIYLSTGYDFDPFPQNRLNRNARWVGRDEGGPDSPLLMDEFGSLAQPSADPFAAGSNMPGAQFAYADLQIDLSELAKAANRSNVSFYAIDPRGLTAGPDISDTVERSAWYRHLTTTQDTLRVLANLTGGLALVNQNDFASGLKRIDAETSDYYVLGYYTNNPDPTIRTRRIDVNVDRDEVTTQHRRRYSFPLPPPEAIAER